MSGWTAKKFQRGTAWGLVVLVTLLMGPAENRWAQGQDRSPAATEKAAATTWFWPEGDSAALRQALGEEQISERWIYHDLDAARGQARETGKPILVVFRCVPCGSAPELDAALNAAETTVDPAAGGDLQRLLDQFVTVRMVQMNGVNRKVFQFDRDIPYVAMFLNADGVVYGRYGTRNSSERKNLPRHKVSSFQQSLRRALELHRNYPQNKAPLMTTQRDLAGPERAEEMDSFVPFPPEHNPPQVSSCIHCHTVGEAEKRQMLQAGQVALRDVWPYPRPLNIGLKMDVEDGLRVESVVAGSTAQKAGIERGDVLRELAGEPLTSEADIQWALHQAPDEGTLPLKLKRGTRTMETQIALQGEWRKSDGHWRASLAPLRPKLELRPDFGREKKGARPGEMGLAVTYPHEAAAKAGLRNGDLLVAVDGRTDLHLEADFLKYIHLDRPQVKQVELTILRKGTNLIVPLPIR